MSINARISLLIAPGLQGAELVDGRGVVDQAGRFDGARLRRLTDALGPSLGKLAGLLGGELTGWSVASAQGAFYSCGLGGDAKLRVQGAPTHKPEVVLQALQQRLDEK